MSLYRLYANVCSEAGQWEKAVEVQTKRAQTARAILADLDKAQAPIAAQWRKVIQESGDYVAKNTPRQQELQTELKALREDVDAVNAKKKKPDAKGLEELKARIAKAPQEEQEKVWTSVYVPALSPVFIPEFLIKIRNNSVGICIYLVIGRRMKKVPNAME